MGGDDSRVPLGPASVLAFLISEISFPDWVGARVGLEGRKGVCRWIGTALQWQNHAGALNVGCVGDAVDAGGGGGLSLAKCFV